MADKLSGKSPNMKVLAVEPGVYFPGRYGARVENVFLVTDDGAVELRAALGADGRG